MTPFASLRLISFLESDPTKYYLIFITIVIASAVPIFLTLSTISTILCSLCRNKKTNTAPKINPSLHQNRDNPKSLSLSCPNRSIKRPKSYISPSKSKQKKAEDDDIESDIFYELDRYRKTKGETRNQSQNQDRLSNIEGLTASIISNATNTTSKNMMNREQFEKLKALEQELSNTKLLNHYTQLRLKKKEKECQQLQISEKAGRQQIRELMNEIASISKKNTDLMSYCETKVAQCREEYERMSKKSFRHLSKNKELEKNISDLKRKLSINATFKNECTKLRASLSGYKTQIKENNIKIDKYKKDIKQLKNNVETQRYRLNETSKVFNKINDEILSHKQENKKLKNNISKYKDKMNELREQNQELIEENKDIKLQIERFSMQLKQQSMIQNQIIDIQQQLNVNKSSVSSSPRSPKSIVVMGSTQDSLDMMRKEIESIASISPYPEKEIEALDKQNLIFSPRPIQVSINDTV